MTLTIPIFPLGTVLFPTCQMPLHIFEARYRLMMEEHGEDPIPFGIALLRDPSPDTGLPCATIGTAAIVVDRHRRPDGCWDIRIEGFRRFRILRGDTSAPFARATVEWLDDDPPVVSIDDARSIQMRRRYRSLESRSSRAGGSIRSNWSPSGSTISDTYHIAARLPLNAWQAQEILEEVNPSTRIDILLGHIVSEQRLLSVGIAGKPILTGSAFTLN